MVNMNQCTDVVDAQPRTGQRHALCIVIPDLELYIRGESREIINGSVPLVPTAALIHVPVPLVPAALIHVPVEIRGQIAEWLGSRAINQKVVGSIPGRAK